MEGNKIMATLIVLLMLLSTMVALNVLNVKFVEKASADMTAGVNDWGNGTRNYVYHPTNTVSVNVNTSNLTANQTYYIMYPKYLYTGGEYKLNWAKAEAGGAPVTVNETWVSKTPASTQDISSPIVLNRTGMWFIARKSLVDAGTDPSYTNLSTLGGFFWVNTSRNYTIDINSGGETVTFGQNETITITVTSGGSSVACWIDVFRASTGTKVFHTYSPTGTLTFNSNWQSNLTRAGNYTIQAYKDVDPHTHGYTEDHGYFNSTYGNSTTFTKTHYKYTRCGPWDPPEYNATNKKITVETGEPTATVRATNDTMYWNFSGRVEIEVHNYDGGNISGLRCYVYNSDDANQTVNFTNNALISVTPSGKEAWIYINSSNWGRKHVSGTSWTDVGENGTWYAYIIRDIDGDHVDGQPNTNQYAWEWNTTVYWTVTTAPGAQFKWIDDDGNLSNDNNDGLIPRVPEISKQPINIQFQIIGSDHSYYGAAATSAAKAPVEKGENITISGDALFLSAKTLDKLPGTTYSGGTWTVPITPTMALNGGELTITCDWSGKGTVTEMATIGGATYNGTIVTISPTEFTIDKNVTFTITVTDPVNQGYGYTNAEVYLYWIYDNNRTLVNRPAGIISKRLGGGTTAGEYTIPVNKTQQTVNQTSAYGSRKAPRNLSAYVKLYKGTPSATSGYVYGYALTKMKPQSDFKVTVEPNTVMAGEKISKLYLNTTIVDSTGNSTGWPKDSGLKVRFYNETGVDVTGGNQIGNIATGSGSKGTDGKANKSATSIYFQKPGIYTVHAYNATHQSEGAGFNATFEVKQVDVSSSISEFIWGVDKNISTILTVTYEGTPINGTLRIDNLSAIGTSYNKTWANCSFAPTIGSTSGSDSKNTSRQVEVKNGQYILYNITANNLSEWLHDGKWHHYSQKEVTFYFKPKKSGSAWARANGMVPVKIPDVTASPESIPYNKPARLELTVTGRGTGLANVFTSIIVPGLSGEFNTTTDGDGQAIFAFTPPTTGEVTIKIENRTSSTKVKITSWSLYIDVDAQADEGTSLTVTVRNETATGAVLEGAAVMFNRETKTTDSSGQVTFTMPSVTANREYTIRATKEGYAEDTAIILTLNKPKLIIIVEGEVSAGSTFDVTIADDTGNPVVGATITINQETYRTGAQGTTTITAPSEEGEYTITATFPGYADADPVTITIEAGGIPGFELLTLIAAIGVAFILLRRRRH